MRSTTRFIVGAMIVAMAPCAIVRASAIDILEWTLRTSVRIGNGNDGRVQTAVSNPLHNNYFASLGNSTAFSTIDASWNTAGNFDFLATGEYADQGSPDGFSRSNGSVYLIPAVDSIITIEGEFNYALGAGDRESEMQVNVGGGPAPGALLYFFSRVAIPIGGSNPNGSFTVSASVPLLAGEFYIIGYKMSLYSYGGGPTDISHGDGYVHFSITPVPEPTTLVFVTMAGWVVTRRRSVA